MPAPAPAITYKSTPVPYNEVYFNDLQLKNLYTANTTPLSGTGWITSSGTGGTAALTYLSSGGPSASGFPASSGFGRLTWSVMPTAGNVGPYRNSSSGPALGVPGATYTHSMWVRTSIDCQIVPRVEYHQGPTTFVASEVGNTVDLVANTWTRISMTRTMPAGVDRSRFVAYSPVSSGWTTAPVGSTFDFSSVLCEQTSDLHDYYFGVSDYQRTNLVSNPSFDTVTTGWNGLGGGSLARSTAQARSGAASALVTISATAGSGIYPSVRSAVSTGYDYTLSAYVRDINNGQTWTATIQWYTAASGGTLVSYISGPAVPITSSGWARVSVTGVAPATATHAVLLIQNTGAGTNGTQVYVDDVLFEQKAGLSDYYSTTAGTNATPDTITVYRLCDGETNIVRGAKNYTASSAFTINDFEAPFGKAIQYWAVTSSSGTSLGIGEIATTTLNVNEIWVHDPLDLTNAIQIFLDGDNDATLGQGSFGQIARGYDYNRTSVLGKSRPVLQFYGEKAIENLQFQILAKAAANEELMNLLSVGPVLVRVPGALGNIPRLLYCALEASQEPIDWHVAGQAAPLTRWSVTANEVEPQSLDIVITFYSYAYWQSRYSSYTAASTVYGASTYIDAVRNPPL
jgi:hypothetical protein